MSEDVKQEVLKFLQKGGCLPSNFGSIVLDILCDHYQQLLASKNRLSLLYEWISKYNRCANASRSTGPLEVKPADARKYLRGIKCIAEAAFGVSVVPVNTLNEDRRVISCHFDIFDQKERRKTRAEALEQ